MKVSFNFNVNFNQILINVHQLVNELCEYQNARHNDKNYCVCINSIRNYRRWQTISFQICWFHTSYIKISLNFVIYEKPLCISGNSNTYKCHVLDYSLQNENVEGETYFWSKVLRQFRHRRYRHFYVHQYVLRILAFKQFGDFWPSSTRTHSCGIQYCITMYSFCRFFRQIIRLSFKVPSVKLLNV